MQKTERNARPAHWAGPKSAAADQGVAPVPGTAASRAKTSTAPPSCTVVSDSGSAPRTPSDRAMSSTCRVRARAAPRMSRSPRPGAVKPAPWVNSTTPSTEAVAAPRKEAEGAFRFTAASASGVKIMVRLMISPALVAEVWTTP